MMMLKKKKKKKTKKKKKKKTDNKKEKYSIPSTGPRGRTVSGFMNSNDTTGACEQGKSCCNPPRRTWDAQSRSRRWEVVSRLAKWLLRMSLAPPTYCPPPPTYSLLSQRSQTCVSQVTALYVYIITRQHVGPHHGGQESFFRY